MNGPRAPIVSLRGTAPGDEDATVRFVRYVIASRVQSIAQRLVDAAEWRGCGTFDAATAQSPKSAHGLTVLVTSSSVSETENFALGHTIHVPVKDRLGVQRAVLLRVDDLAE